MEQFTTTFLSNVQNDSNFVTFISNNNNLLTDVVNRIFNEEKHYGVATTQNNLTEFHAILFYKVILPYIYTTLGLTWDNTILFTIEQQHEINLKLRLKNYTI